jgi:hypothetical protein
MRRFLWIGALVAVLGALFATSAGARTETRFSVIAHQTSGHRAGNQFVIHGRLLQPGDRDDVVGRFRAKFSRRGRVHAVAVFPDGKLKAQGNTRGNRNGRRIPIVGGSGRWNGAAGKLKTHNLGHHETLLTFIVVQ